MFFWIPWNLIALEKVRLLIIQVHQLQFASTELINIAVVLISTHVTADSSSSYYVLSPAQRSQFYMSQKVKYI